MALQFENHSVPFSGGIDQEDTEKMVPPGRVLTAVNVVQTHSKKFEKRNGSVALVKNNVLAGYSTGALLCPFNQELIEGGTLATGLVAQTSLAAEAQQWSLCGQHQPISVGVGKSFASSYDHNCPDEASANGICVYAYESQGQLYGSIVSQDTGKAFVTDQVLSTTGVAARVVALGNSITVFYLEHNTVYARTVWTGVNPAFGTPVPIQENTAHFEARAITGTGSLPATSIGGATIAMVWQTNTTAIYMDTWNPWLQAKVSSTQVAASSSGMTNIFLWCMATSAYMLVGWDGVTSGPAFYWVGKQSLTVTGPTTIASGPGQSSNGGAGNVTAVQTAAGVQVTFEYYAVPGAPPVLYGFQTAAAFVGTIAGAAVTQTVRSVTLYSDAFLAYSTPVAVCAYTSIFQPTYFLVNLLNGSVLAKMQPTAGGGTRTNAALTAQQRLAAPTTDLVGNTLIPVMTLTPASGTFNGVRVNIRAVTETVLGFSASQYQDQLGPNLYLTGGFLASYDGNSFQEHMTHLFPEPPTILAGTVGVVRVQQGIGQAPGGSEQASLSFPGLGSSALTIPNLKNAACLQLTATTGGVGGNGYTFIFQGGTSFGIAVAGMTITITFNNFFGGSPSLVANGINTPSQWPSSNQLFSATPLASGYSAVADGTYGPTAGGGVFDCLVIVAVAAGAAGNGYTVILQAGATASILVVGMTITITYVTGATPTQVANQMNNVGNWPSSNQIFRGFPQAGTSASPTVGTYGPTSNGGTAPGVGGIPEITDIYMPPDTLSADTTTFGSGWQIAPGSGFYLWNQQNNGLTNSVPVFVYYMVNGVGSLPVDSTIIAVPVEINATDNAFTVASKTAAALGFYSEGAYASFPWFTAAVAQTGGTPTGGSPTYKVTVTNGGVLYCTSYAPGNASTASTDFRIDCSWSTTPGAIDGTVISCPPASAIMPGGYFLFVNGAGMICFYFVVAGVAPAPPTNVNTGGFCTQDQVTVQPVFVNTGDDATTGAIDVLSALQTAAIPNIANYSLLTGTPFVIGAITAGQYGGQPGYNVSSSGLLPDGTYIYQYCFEWTDEQGQRQQSAPSPAYTLNIQGVSPTWINSIPQTIDPTGHGNDLLNGFPDGQGGAVNGGYPGTLVGGCAPQLTLGTLRLTAKQNVWLVVYRSQVSVGNNPVLSRASSPLSPILNNVNLDTLTYTETTPDSLLLKNLPLYTSGSDGLWPAMAAPAFSFARVHRGRIAGISSEYPNQWWPSQPYVTGSGISPAYNSNITVPVPADGGPLVGFCTMNEKVYFFENTRIYFSTGDGPGADVLNVAGTSYSAPDLVSTSVGCSAPGSILLTPMGIMFQSSKGFAILDPGGNVSHKIGLQVQDLVQGQTCISSVLMPDRGEARFAMSGGYTLVFNYFFGMWYQFTGWGGPATIWQSTYVFYSPIGQGGAGAGVCQETPGVYTDGDGSLVYSLVDLFWAAWAGPQGYQRVRYATFLGTFGSDHSLVCTVAYNYQQTAGEQTVWNATGACDPSQFGSDAQYGEATPYGDPILGVYQCRLNPGIQLCESIKLTFQDTALPTAGGAGFALEDLTFNVGLESGTMRLPSGAGGHQAG